MRRWVVIAALVTSRTDPASQWWVGCAECAGGAGYETGRVVEQMHYDDMMARRRRNWPTRNWVRYPLAAGDVVEEDGSGHVTAVRHATTPPTWTRFKPGAVSPPNENIVWGELE